MEILAVPYGLRFRARYAKNGYLGGIDDGCETRSPNPAQRGNREAPTLHVRGIELSLARPRGKNDGFRSDLRDAFTVDIADHRNEQSVCGVDGKPDVKVSLEY